MELVGWLVGWLVSYCVHLGHVTVAGILSIAFVFILPSVLSAFS
jgi:hypothetical protein